MALPTHKRDYDSDGEAIVADLVQASHLEAAPSVKAINSLVFVSSKSRGSSLSRRFGDGSVCAVCGAARHGLAPKFEPKADGRDRLKRTAWHAKAALQRCTTPRRSYEWSR